MSKVFVGTWISKEARVRLKMSCAKHNVYQGDIIEQLILNWLEKKHIKDD